MFLRAFVEIRMPAEAAVGALRQLPQTLVESFAVKAIDHGRTVLAEVGFPMAGWRVGKQVEIELGDPVETPSRTWLPLWWKATGPGGFFPSLEGELEAAALGKNLTQIGLSARYKPPFGVVGTTLDRMFLHRVAEATIQDFLQRVAEAVESPAQLNRIPGPEENQPAVVRAPKDGKATA
jgi:hypothetical protein